MRHSKSGCTAGPQLEGKGATFEPSHGEDEDEYSDRLSHLCYDHDPDHADKDLSIMQNQLYLKFPLRSVETGQSNFNQNLPQCNHHPDLCLIHDTYSVTRGQKFCLLTILYTFAFNTKINNGLFLPLSMLSGGF